MKELGNKTLILLLCMTRMPSVTETGSVAACLIVIIITCLNLCLRSKNGIAVTVLICVYCAATLFFPPLTYFLPVLFYDVIWEQPHAVLSCVFLSAAILSFFPNHPLETGGTLLLFSAAAILLQYYSRKTDALLAEFHRYRDDSTETSLSLRQKNKALLLKQDYEIHVATLSERNRIARDIHDNVGHLITRSLLQTGAIQVINQEETLKEPLQNLHETLDTAMTSIRNSVHDLHDESLSLEHVLRELAHSVVALHVTLDYEIEHDLPKELKYAFIAVVKEALNNSVKHSNADKLNIHVKEHPSFYQLEIQDNGTTTAINETGIGLTGMQERIHSLGGIIRITNDNGFRIFISVLKKERKEYYENLYRR